MIKIISKKTLYYHALSESLKGFDILPEQSQETPDLYVIYLDQAEVDDFLKTPLSCPVILLGTHHEEADVELPLPCHISELTHQIEQLSALSQQAPCFENQRFIFDGAHRLLKDKQTGQDYKLTEKETALLSYMVKSLPDGVSKTDLLTGVWKYNPDAQTHTVESHIYALRQKIQDEAELIKNTIDGYELVQA